VYDYGQYGVELKNNIKKYWWDSMILLHENVVGLDSAIFMHPTIWKASGHVDAFNDPLIDNKDSKKRYRADVLIEEHIAKIEDKINKEVEKAKERFGESFDEKKFRETNQRVLANQVKIDEINARFAKALNDSDLPGIRQIILDNEIVCPVSGTRNWTEVRQFNLMFSTEMGSTSEGANKIYLRPETAQGMFVNFKNVQRTMRKKIPFGIGQIGKSFRNEITPGNFIFRTREFEQMELEFFCKPGEDLQWYAYWKETCFNWLLSLGVKPENLRLREHEKAELSHYSAGTSDIEYKFPWGFDEIWGIADRTNYDLSQHEKFSGVSMEYLDPMTNEKYIPYCVEPAVGVERLFLTFLNDAYEEQQLENDTRVVLHFHPALAPYKAAILPLSKQLSEQADAIRELLAPSFMIDYDEAGSIGKRYRRQDAMGTPYCITVDFDTATDGKVTIRERDSMKQERIAIGDLQVYILSKISF